MSPALHDLVERGEARQRRLGALALYPAVMAAISLLLAAGFLYGVRPTFDFLLRQDPDLGRPPSVAPVVIAVTVAVICLLYLAAVLRSRRSLFPLRRERESFDRVVVVAAASIHLSEGKELTEALRGAAAHTHTRPMRRATEELADALGRGEAGGELLLGETGAACLAAAAGRGEAQAVLEDLSLLLETEVEARLPWSLVRVELITLLLGGLALGAVAASLYQSYLSLVLPT